MKGLRFLAPLALAVASSSCSLLLDWDELQGGTPGTGGIGASGASGSGGSNTGGTGGAGIPLDEAPAAIADALCEKLETCVGAAAMELLFYDEECRVAGSKLLENTVVATIDETGSDYDPASVPACVEAFEALDCEGVSLTFPEECKQILGGLKADGEPCVRSLECEAGLYCTTGSCPGTCSVPIAQGSPCALGDSCADGLTCFQGVCEPLGKENEECGGTVRPACLTGLFCGGADDAAMTPGMCIRTTDVFVLTQNAICSVSNPPSLCKEGLSCPVIGLPSRCLPRVESGGVCQLAVPDMCPEGEYCNAGSCAPLPGAGDNCAVGIILKPTCQAYLRCIDGKCRRLGDIGNTCLVGGECYSGTCFDGECVAPRCQ